MARAHSTFDASDKQQLWNWISRTRFAWQQRSLRNFSSFWLIAFVLRCLAFYQYNRLARNIAKAAGRNRSYSRRGAAKMPSSPMAILVLKCPATNAACTRCPVSAYPLLIEPKNNILPEGKKALAYPQTREKGDRAGKNVLGRQSSSCLA